MWNLSYSNRKCNEFERIREHKMHLERIVTSKKVIDIVEPVKPSFLVFKAKKERMEQERKFVVDKENFMLFNKIANISSKPSPYNPINQRVKYCPAFDKTNYRKKVEKLNVEKDNVKLYTRLVSAKPHYRTNNLEKDYGYQVYLESMISKTKNNVNPNLNFETPSVFKKKLTNLLMTSESFYKNNLARPYTAAMPNSNQIKTDLPELKQKPHSGTFGNNRHNMDITDSYEHKNNPQINDLNNGDIYYGAQATEEFSVRNNQHSI